MNNKPCRLTNGHRNGRNHPLLVNPSRVFGWLVPKPRVHCIPTVSGPMELLSNRQMLVICDVENLSYSANKLALKVSYASLADRLRKAAKSAEFHAFFSRQPGQEGWVNYFRDRGWTPHVRDIEIVQTCRGQERLANADNLIAFHAGNLAAKSSADVLLCSGDGSLVCDLARALAELPVPRGVFTLGFPGAISNRLHSQCNQLIAGNLELGMDCLRPAERNGTRIWNGS